MGAASRLVYCRYEDCRIGFAIQDGMVPKVCPGCERVAYWTTKVPSEPPTKPRPWLLTDRDCIMLVWFGIVPE